MTSTHQRPHIGRLHSRGKLRACYPSWWWVFFLYIVVILVFIFVFLYVYVCFYMIVYVSIYVYLCLIFLRTFCLCLRESAYSIKQSVYSWKEFFFYMNYLSSVPASKDIKTVLFFWAIQAIRMKILSMFSKEKALC